MDLKKVIDKYQEINKKNTPLSKEEKEFLDTYSKEISDYECTKEKNARVVSCYEKPRSKNPNWGKS